MTPSSLTCEDIGRVAPAMSIEVNSLNLVSCCDEPRMITSDLVGFNCKKFKRCHC